MPEDFFARALLAGVGTAAVAGPLGCLVTWRRLAFFGDTLAYSALLGVALALALQVAATPVVFAVSAGVAVLLTLLQARTQIASDTLLGLLAHGALAVSIVALTVLAPGRVDVTALLFGDILAVSDADLWTIWLGGAALLVLLGLLWRRLFAVTVDAELAAAEGLSPRAVNLIFVLMLAGVVAVSIRTVGALLVTSLLLLPAAAARPLVRGPEAMALVAAAIGVVSALTGLQASLAFDTPSGPSIVVAALVLFALCHAVAPLLGGLRR